MKKNGFTLIEILIVIGIFGILAFIGTNMFFTILKSSAKTRVLAEVKQNGNYALSVMGRMIRNAKRIEVNSDGDACKPSMGKLRIKNSDEGCSEFDLSGSRIASSSANDCITFSPRYLTSEEVEIDTSMTNQFECTAITGSPPVITIRFTLSQTGTTTRPEEEATVDFRTTVSLRTY